jgi:hypothetical protein
MNPPQCCPSPTPCVGVLVATGVLVVTGVLVATPIFVGIGTTPSPERPPEVDVATGTSVDTTDLLAIKW